MMRTILITFVYLFLFGCTTSAQLKFEAIDKGGYEFTEEDLDKIDRGFVEIHNKEPAYSPRSYFLTKDTRAWDTVSFEKTEKGILFSVGRLSKYIRGFSERWKKEFIVGTRNLIKATTSKDVVMHELDNDS